MLDPVDNMTATADRSVETVGTLQERGEEITGIVLLGARRVRLGRHKVHKLVTTAFGHDRMPMYSRQGPTSLSYWRAITLAIWPM